MKFLSSFFLVLSFLFSSFSLQAQVLAGESTNQYLEKNLGPRYMSAMNEQLKCLDANPPFVQPATDKKKLNLDCQTLKDDRFLVAMGWKAAQETKASLQQAYAIFQVRDSKGQLLADTKFLCVPISSNEQGALIECSITFEVEKQKKTLNFSVFYFPVKAGDKNEVFVLVSDKAENKKEEVTAIVRNYISLFTKNENAVTASKSNTSAQ